ncbi:MAG: ATP-binding cassette domain-containing protein [Deltaproteobacteria bacterium]|nr:ATP-binding cassette domain-containing protein [Deltaproteobacteria bacterium]
MVDVKFDAVTKILGQVKAVNRLTLEIEPKELFFLLGPSGCGKTTALRLVAGFYTPDEGQILFNGEDKSTVPPHKRNTGMVFQNYALWPHMTVQKNVAYGLNLRKVSESEKQKRVRRALEIVRMDHYAERLPNQLSGGEQQRVALARALVIEPDVVLLDEPLSNLDAHLRTEMRAEIKQIHSEIQRTMIYVTHDQTEALSMADRVAVMRGGQVVQVGPPRTLYARPESSFVAKFIGGTNLFTGTLQEAGDPMVVNTPFGVLEAAHNPQNLSRGAVVYCSVRPESLQLVNSGSRAKRKQAPAQRKANRLEGSVESITYLGSNEQYTLRLADESRLQVVEHNPHARKAEVGDKVSVEFQAEDVVVLPQEN